MKKLLTLAVSLAVSLCALALTTAARADPIGGPNCLTCQGAILTLTSDFIDIGADPTTSTFHFVLEINTAGVTIPGATGIDAVAIKVASSADTLDLVAFGAPAGWTGGLAGLNANGCGGGGGGFACLEGPQAALGGTLTFTFDIEVTDFASLIQPGSVKVRFVDVNGDKVGDLISEKIPLQCPPGSTNCTPPPFDVPEPNTLALLGLAFVGLAAAANRRRRIR